MYKIKQGNCLELMMEIPAGSVDLIVTDLPFGITDCAFDRRIPFEPMWEQFWRVCKPNAAIALFSVGKFTIELAASQLKYYRYEWIYEKDNAGGFLNAKKIPLRAHENILIFYKKLPTYNPQFTKGKPYKHETRTFSENYSHSKILSTIVSEDGRRYPRTVVKFQRPKYIFGKGNKKFHAQQKPVDLLEYLIKTYSNEGETVLDCTMGSGSTGVACMNTSRRFIGFELEEKFFNIAQKRISEALK